MTKKKIEQFIRIKDVIDEKQEKIEEKIENVLKEKAKLKGNKDGFDRLEDIEFTRNDITGTKVYRRYCGCCSDDYESFRFPTFYLYDSSWISIMKKEIEDEKKQKETLRRKEDEERKRKREEKERNDWLRLKEKFEDGEES